MAKGVYIGVNTSLPIYTEQTITVSITADNISTYFDVTNGSSYYFKGSGSTFTTNNGGVDSSTATTVLKSKYALSALSFNYSYSSEANYDKFTLKVGGTTVESAVSGATTSKSYSGTLSAGQTIEFTYAKDSSQNRNDDKCTFSNMSITYTGKVQTGSETKSVARKVKKVYEGVSGVARKVKKGYIGVGGVARQFFSGLPINSTTVGDVVSFGGYNWTIVHNDNQYVYLAMNGSLLNDLPSYTSSDYDYNNRWKSLIDAMNAAQTMLPGEALSQIATRTITSPSGEYTGHSHSYTGKLWMPVLDDYARFDYYNYSQDRRGTVYTDLLTDSKEHWRYMTDYDSATYIGNVFGGIEVPDYSGLVGTGRSVFHPVFAEPRVSFEDGIGMSVIWCYVYEGSGSSRKFNEEGILSFMEATSDYNPTTWRPHIMIPLQ